MGNRLYIPVTGGLMPTRCREMTERLHRRADGRLPEAEDSALSQHLATCPYCAEDWARLQWVAASVQRRRAVSPGFTDRVLRRVAAPRPVPARSYAPRGFWQWAPAAAGLVLALGFHRGLLRLVADRIPIPRLDQVALDLPVAAFTLGVALFAAVLFGVIPAVFAARSRSYRARAQALACCRASASAVASCT